MIKQKLALVPSKPGCYLMKDKNKTVIYVGKAKNLKNRLTSYFVGKNIGKTRVLVENIVDFEYIITTSEIEALILELNLIKKYDPKYNVLYKDDKSYPYIEITNDKYPKVAVVRNVKKGKNTKLYGPYPNVYAARKIVNLINRIYPLRKCTHFPKKECLYYHINECLGYCCKDVDEQEVNRIINEISSFLNGNDEIIINKVTEKMNAASEKYNYELALEYKQLLDDIKIVLEKQKVEIDDNINKDVISYAYQNGYLSIQIFFIRGGKILGRHSKIFPIIDEVETEVLNYIINFYNKNHVLPKQILISKDIDRDLLASVVLTNILIPQKGQNKKIIDMVSENAKMSLKQEFELIKRDENKTLNAVKTLNEVLDENINRIEIFDLSHLFGTYYVGGMVVYVDGLPKKNEYRKYKISIDSNDEYQAMREIIYRRYFRVLKDNLERPQLIIVDGGRGQISVAKEIIDSLGLSITICGLVKNDKHSTNELMDENYSIIKIDKGSNLFHLLTRMQDEVHNFTINYHKQIRSKGSLESVLDNVEGIGAVRKKQLLKKYGSVKKISEASIEDLKKTVTEKIAISLKEYLENYKD